MKRELYIVGVRRGVAVTMALMMSLSLASVSACSKSSRSAPPAESSAPSQEPDLEHRVQYQGETLGLIARWYTGRSQNWTAIRDANPGLRPERINLGQVIMIPRALVVEERPMPRDFVPHVARRPVTKEGVDAEELESEPEVAAEEERPAVPSLEVAPMTEPVAEAPIEPATPPGSAAVDSVDEAAVPDAEAPATAPESALSADDEERERLLDELLQQ